MSPPPRPAAGFESRCGILDSTFDVLDEAGQVLCRVEMPKPLGPGLSSVSPDGNRLASHGLKAKMAGSRCSTRRPASRPRSVKDTATASGRSPSARTARDSRRPAKTGLRACGTRPPAPARHFSGAHEQGPRRRVQPERHAPPDGLGGRDSAPVGRRHEPGSRSALRSPCGRSLRGRVQPGRAMGRLGGQPTGPSGCGGRRVGRTWRSCTATRGP